MNKQELQRHLPTLETERLILRPLTHGDKEDLFEYASRDEVSRFVPWSTHESIEDTDEFLHFILSSERGERLSPWAMIEKDSGKMIGTIDYVSWRESHRNGEIGYALSSDYWGKGYTTEAAKRVVQFGFEEMNLHKVTAQVLVENLQSQRVLQKIGMKLEGVLQEHMYMKGAFRDMALYGIVKK
ncbi:MULTISPECIES: GNAT family N-acetyltransferase [Pontibacillus]|uniref:GNAT family protein n=1 Tax=Pontibacillus chungwhensis TaxID=265426 RepID=A0ABY8V114_9BACI|nr:MULTISPECIES: GNAT family protein [Pontibacillus]MCD5322342.1 GNAT family N-acetyltransferase [Pontibacillus sp. HN14]WIF99632.1 GNAT family protein [Pontibacillus chungwhensis]